jgi:signal transduction histidine kinase/ligand-binding sensor domain-containing protein
MAFMAVLCLTAAPAHALDPARRLSQYGHSAWRTQDGAFGGTPTVMTQTADGYLWIGTNIGLVRYNGNRFVQWTPPSAMRLLDPRVFALDGARDGSLWIGTGIGTSQWKNGQLVNYRRPDGRTDALIADSDSSAWIVRTQAGKDLGALCRVGASGFRCLKKTDGVPFASAAKIAADTSGNIWIGGYFGVCRWRPGSAAVYFPEQPRSDYGVGSVKALAAAPDGSVWASIENSASALQLEQYQDGRWATRVYPQIEARNADVLAIFVDRTNSVWLGTAHNGIFRIQGTKAEHFGSEDGLSSDAIGSFFQDREGTIWVVTSAGVDNFHDTHVVNFSMREGMYADGASSLIAGHDGTVWIGNFQSLNYLRDGRISAIREGQGFPGRNVTTLFEDHAGRIWLGIDKGLWVYEDNRFRAVLRTDGSLMGIVFSICEDVDHSIWVRAGPNLDRIQDFKVQEEATSADIARAYIMTAHPAGGVVLGLVNGDLLRYVAGKAEILPESIDNAPGQHLPAQEEDPDRHVRDLLVRADGSIWGTTVEEFFIWKDGKRESLTTLNGLPCDVIFALLDDHRGSLWLSTACGLVKIANEEIDRWWKHPRTAIKAELVVGILDGVQPGLTSLKPQIAATPDGRIWLVNGRMLQMFDPYDLRKNEIPPPVRVERITADRKVYFPQADLRLPPRTRDLRIDYAALSFVVPGKVRYRYKLEGHDQDWQEPDNRHQAFYSDLPPGRYRFRVIACNNDGVWNETGAELNFFVAPAYYQTEWFRLLCIMVAASALWLLYRVRMWRMRESINSRFNERMAERTRVAREIHDTLLQTIQGSKMVADDALEDAADVGRMRYALERVSLWLEQATTEGRAALNSLRASTTQVNDLSQAFERAARECSANQSMEFVMLVEGVAQEMHPIVRDEVYRIGYEAIRNACTHSGGTRLEVDLSYSRALVLRVRDNGKGINPDIAATGKAGHFGLKGMHERALRVGATLTLSSSAYSGTEVELVVPGDRVFYSAHGEEQNIIARLGSILRR